MSFWTKEEVHIYRTFRSTFIVGIKLCHLTLFGLVCIVHYRSTWSIILLLWILIKTLGNRNVSIQCQWCQWCHCVLGVRLPESCWCKQLRIITKSFMICNIFAVYIVKEFVSFVFGAEEKNISDTVLKDTDTFPRTLKFQTHRHHINLISLPSLASVVFRLFIIFQLRMGSFVWWITLIFVNRFSRDKSVNWPCDSRCNLP